MRELFNLAVGVPETRSVSPSDHLAIVSTDAGLIRVTIHLDNGSNRSYEMLRGDSVGPLPEFSSITVVPVEAAGAFIVVPSMGRFMPSADGAEVVINGEVNMTADTTVGIKTNENTIKIDPVANVVQLASNIVALADNAVDATGSTIKLDATGNTVKIDPANNTVKLNTDQIGIDPNKNLVRVDGQINVGTVTVGPESTVAGLPMLTTDGTALQTINANGSRKRIYVMADEDNASPIWLGATAANNGIPLLAGMGLEIPVTGALSVYGANGMKLYALETE